MDGHAPILIQATLATSIRKFLSSKLEGIQKFNQRSLESPVAFKIELKKYPQKNQFEDPNESHGY